MRRKQLLLLVVACATFEVPAKAAILFTGTLGINSSVNNFDIDQFDLDLVFLDNQLFPTNLVNLFDDLVITPGNVGDTFEATAASDPQFSTVVDRLTDASNEFIRVDLTEDEVGGLSEKRGMSESNFFANGTPPTAPDPAETTIDSITLRIDQFVLLTNEEAGANDPIDLVLTFTINGTQVPEPTAGWLALCGLSSFGLLWFCRRKQPMLAKAPVQMIQP